MADILSIIDRADSTDLLEAEFSAPQAILPLQFYGVRRGTSELEPLRRLMVAMLADAVRCFQTKFDRRQPGKRQEFAEVQCWLFSDGGDGPFSFMAVCDALEIDPEIVRQGLLRWAAERLSGRKPRMIRRSSLSAKRISA